MTTQFKVEEKQCGACGNTFPATRAYFYVAPENPCGFRRKCKTCERSGSKIKPELRARAIRKPPPPRIVKVIYQTRTKFDID